MSCSQVLSINDDCYASILDLEPNMLDIHKQFDNSVIYPFFYRQFQNNDSRSLADVKPRIADESVDKSRIWKLTEINEPTQCRSLRLPDNLTASRVWVLFISFISLVKIFNLLNIYIITHRLNCHFGPCTLNLILVYFYTLKCSNLVYLLILNLRVSLYC